jgi:hypothetical protein
MESDSYRNFLQVWVNRKLKDKDVPINFTGCKISCGSASVTTSYTANRDANIAMAIEAFMQLVPMEYFESWSFSDFNNYFKVEFFKSF